MPDLEKSEHVQRLTLRQIMHDLATRFFSLESGWLRTFKELFTEPGQMIRRYIDGERKAYANPFAYLLVATAISVLIQNSVGFQDWMMETNLANPDLRPGQIEFIQGMQEYIFQHLLYVSLGILLPFAVFLRLFFRRSGLNLAEMTVFALYTTGHTSLFAVVLLPLTILSDLHPLVTVPVGLIYLCYAAIRFFGGRVMTAFKTCVAYGLAFAGYMVIILAATIIYILTLGLSEFRNADKWNLVTATEHGAAAVVERLIGEGANVNMALQSTPLHVATDQGDMEIVDLLLANGADVDTPNHSGQVPLFLAIRKGHLEIAWRLIHAGAEPPATTDSGYTLLMVAVRAEDLQLVRWLLDNGSPVNAVRPDGKRVTALMMAADEGDEAAVQLLLEYGADPSIKNDKGKTALDHADSDAIEKMLKAGPSPGPNPVRPKVE